MADAATIVVVVAVVVAERTSNCNSTYYEEGLAFWPALFCDLVKSKKHIIFQRILVFVVELN